MKIIPNAGLAGLLAVSLASAATLTENNVERAQAVIDAAVKAHGGPERLAALETLLIEHESVIHAVGQSRGTEPPWDQGESRGFDAIDLDAPAYVARTATVSGGFEGLNGTIINGDDSYQLDYRAGTVARIAEPDLDTTAGPFMRVTPTLLVRALHERAANAHYLGETTVDGVAYDVVGFSMAVGPAISLYFDQKKRLLRRSERVLPDLGLAQYEFRDYEIVDGMPFAQRFRFYFNGDLNIDRSIESVAVNEPIDEVLVVDANLEAIPAQEPDPLTRQQVADGVWLIGSNGTYAMFVDMGDYLFAAGGTAGIPERIASLREVAGDKPIRYGMLTHHHFDHVLGVKPYEAEAATVIGAAAHEAVARRAADDGEGLDFEAVENRMVLESGGRVVEVLDLGPTAHTEHLLVAYLPQQGILFEADHFAMPRVGPIPPAVSSTRTFAAQLEHHDLDVRQLLSAHSSRIATMADLETALEAEVFEGRQAALP